MSQVKKMKEDLNYLKRFSMDMKRVSDDISSKIQEKSYGQACDEIFSYLRKHFEKKIQEEKEKSDNVEIEDTLTLFSNEALNLILEIKRIELQKIYGLHQQRNLIDTMLKSSVDASVSLRGEIDDIARKEVADDVIHGAPPKRGNLRPPGEKPNKLRSPGEKPDKRISIQRAAVNKSLNLILSFAK